MKPTKTEISKRLKLVEDRRSKPPPRLPAIVHYHYPVGATQEEKDRLGSAAKAVYCEMHPECDPRRPAICLGLAYNEKEETR